MVKFLVSKGANPDVARGKDGQTSRQMAVERNLTDISEYFNTLGKEETAQEVKEEVKEEVK